MFTVNRLKVNNIVRFARQKKFVSSAREITLNNFDEFGRSLIGAYMIRMTEDLGIGR